MKRRRAGRRLRQQARKRQREFLREAWPDLLRFIGGIVALGAAGTTFMAWIAAPGWAFFMAGAFTGMLMMSLPFILNYLDPIGGRIRTGLNGERLTADELRKLRRRGWRAVHNIELQSGDIDHVVVGPGGVIVIETKSSNAEWDFLKRRGVVDRWARQAADSAFRARHLIRQHCDIDVETVAYIAAWIPRQPDRVGRLTNGVVRIKGRQLREHLLTLPAVLDPDVVNEIARALERTAAGLDARSASR